MKSKKMNFIAYGQQKYIYIRSAAKKEKPLRLGRSFSG